MNNRIQIAINVIKKSLNKTKLNLSKLGLTKTDLIYIFNIEKYQIFFAKLEYLYLEFNNLEDLPERIFDNLVNLEWLYVDRNNIEDLPEKIFDKLVNLEVLNLSRQNSRYC